jgi:hypothetical protein
MDPEELVALSKHPSFALTLAKWLPCELVQKIQVDLPLLKILEILFHKSQYLDECVLGQLKWQSLFCSPADISLVTDLFILYREIHRFGHKSLTSNFFELA